MKRFRKLKIAVITTTFLTIAAFCWQKYTIYKNRVPEHTTIGNDADSDTYMAFNSEGSSTGSWIKRDYELFGEVVNIIGNTFEGTLHNDSDASISSWTLRVNITKDCYINQAWNGEVEIHQYVGTADERVQRVYLQDYGAQEISLQYQYDGELLMIPLKAGDYIIYYPNNQDTMRETKGEEQNIAANGRVTIGMIFYYMDDLNLSDYTIAYHYEMAFNQGVGFWAFIVIGTLWLMFSTALVASSIVFHDSEKMARLQKTSLASMSDIYEIVYLIDLEKNKLTPIYADEQSEKMRPKDMGAKEQLQNMFTWDAEDAFQQMMQEFADLDTIRERMEDKHSLVCEYISKTYGWCSIRFFAVENEDKNKDKEGLQKVLFTIEIIDAEKKQMSEAQERVLKAESESKARSAFLANMSHEIRTPINAILGFNNMILRSAKDKMVRSYSREIGNAGNMLLSLINGILDFSKIEAGKMTLVPVEYSLKSVICDAYLMTKSRMEAKDLAFKLNVSENLPDKLYGDDLRLKQIIINLLTNAVKYTEQGFITLSVFGQKKDDSVHLLFSVSDTGMGIKEDELDKLAQRFTRLDEKKNRNVEGTGLGLSLVNGLLELMDSELHVVSTYGQGSEFYFEIDEKVLDDAPIGKLDPNAIEVKDDGPADFSIKTKDTTILVVDDNDINLTVFDELLTGTDISIVKENSGEKALRETLKTKFDIIFMDHMMPEMDGVECFHKIREQENGLNRETPVIMLTADAVAGAKDECMAEGFNGYLTKPIQLERLEQQIIDLLPEDKMTEKQVRKEKDEESDKEKLPEIDGVDNSYAVSHMGSVPAALKVMNQFADLYEGDAEELEGYFNRISADGSDKDAISSYRTKVHAMKTSANLVGALGLYGVAYELEMAARNEDAGKINAISPYFMEAWRDMGGKIKASLGIKETERKDSLDGEKEELLHQLKTSISAYDIKNSDALIKQINQYKFTEEEMQLVDELKSDVAKLDAENAVRICDELLNK